MSVPGQDEKVCPFCAEVIKAAAIKCRFCHSDLPVDTPEVFDEPELPAADLAAVPPPAVPPPAVPPPPPLPGAPKDRTGLIAGGLVLLSVVLAATSIWLYRSAPADDLRTASNGQVTSTAYRDAALSAAATNAATVLSYSYKTFDADQKAAGAVTGGAFTKEYEGVMATARPKAMSAKLTLKATVMASSLTSLKKDTAVALLFVNAVTTAEGSDKQQLNQNRVLMTMTRKDGNWIVSKIDAF